MLSKVWLRKNKLLVNVHYYPRTCVQVVKRLVYQSVILFYHHQSQSGLHLLYMYLLCIFNPEMRTPVYFI